MKLNSFIISSVNFDKADMAAVLKFLNSESKELDPEHAGIAFYLRWPPDAEAKSLHLRHEVSITLDNVPLHDLLLYICEQTNLTFKIINGTVVFIPVR